MSHIPCAFSQEGCLTEVRKGVRVPQDEKFMKAPLLRHDSLEAICHGCVSRNEEWPVALFSVSIGSNIG